MLDALRESLRDRIGAQRYATWFEGSVGLACSDAEVRLTAATPFERDLLRKSFDEELRQSIHAVLGEATRVTYLVQHAAADPPAAKAGSAPKRSAPPLAPAPSPESTGAPPPAAQRPPAAPLEFVTDWVEGPFNLEATRLSQRVAARSCGGSPVVLWGPSGSGKTRLLGEIARAARARRRKVLSLTAEQFLISFVEAIRGGGLPSFRQKHRGVDLLIVDNVQMLLGKQRTTEEFLQTIDALALEGAQLVLSADRDLTELRALGPEIASRLAAGAVAELRLPDAQGRSLLLRQAAAERGLDLPAEAISTLSNRLMGGAREVQGALNRLGLLAETFDLPIDARLAERVADELNRVATPPVRLDDIQRAVCGVMGVDARELKSNKRTKAVTEPRMLAMWLSRKLTGSAWSEIGDYFGRRSHSTVISAHRRVEKLLASPQPTRIGPSGADLGDTIRRVEAALRMA